MNWNFFAQAAELEKNGFAKSITEKYSHPGFISFNSVCGSCTNGARGTTALFTACKFCTILQPLDGAAFLMGKRGVLHGDSGHSFITPDFSKASNVGSIPLAASGFMGY